MSLQEIVKIYDGEVQGAGGGTTPADVKQLIAATIPDVVIQVSPTFIASNQYNQYPTIAEAMTRAGVLIGLGKNPLIRIFPGGYYEVLNFNFGATKFCFVEFLPDAFLAGDATSTPLITTQSGFTEIRGLKTLSYVSGVKKSFLLDAQSGSWLFIKNSDMGWVNINYLGIPDDNADHIMNLQEGSTVYGYGCRLGNVGIAGSQIVATGASGNFRSFYQSEFWTLGYAALDLRKGTLSNWATVFDLQNCSIFYEGLVANPTWSLITAEQYCRFGMINTPVPKDALNLFGDYSQHTLLSPDCWIFDDAIWQKVIVRSGDVDSQRYFNMQMDEWKGKTDTSVRNNSMNIGKMLSETELEGPFDGVIREKYGDTDDIDAGSSYNYKVDTSNGNLELGKFITVDNFESYADDAAIQAAWPTSDTDFQIYLETAIIEQGSKSARFVYNYGLFVDPAGAYCRKTFGSSQDFTSVSRVRGWVAGGPTVSLRIRLRDGSGNLSNSDLIYCSGNTIYTKFDVGFTPAVGFNSANVTNIDIQFVSSSARVDGQLWLDDIYLVMDDVFTTDGTVDNMDTVVADWSKTGANIAISQNNTTYKQGTGSMQVVVSGDPVGNTIFRSFGSPPPIDKDHSCLHIWTYISAVTAGGVINIKTTLINGSNEISLPEFKINSADLGGDWLWVSIPISKFTLDAGSVFFLNGITGIKFTLSSSSFVGTFLLDWIETGFGSQVVSVRNKTNFWEGALGAPGEGEGAIVASGAFSTPSRVNLDTELLLDVSMINDILGYLWSLEYMDDDPLFQIMGKQPGIDADEWEQLAQAIENIGGDGFFRTRIYSIHPCIINGWTWMWR